MDLPFKDSTFEVRVFLRNYDCNIKNGDDSAELRSLFIQDIEVKLLGADTAGSVWRPQTDSTWGGIQPRRLLDFGHRYIPRRYKYVDLRLQIDGQVPPMTIHVDTTIRLTRIHDYNGPTIDLGPFW
jgi:hypothetical protein